MPVNRRTQAERSAATREALVSAATTLFAEHGYGGVGTETIVAAAGVTRGALYHQFADKSELFAAVFEAMEMDLAQRLGAQVLADAATDPVAALESGADAWLDVCAEPAVQQILLLDAPTVLGWARWREIGLRHAGALVESALQAGIDAGMITPQPVRPLAHVLIGALDEGALYCARADDPEAAREQTRAVFRRLLSGLLA
ncbi:MAG: TetR/AcrR family transcriptional regulator [Solirubrobacteraceae bacterium]|nr:TetR/AcrR family transcriptional regulator [Solirubrobacteraceae bacterium]